MNLTWQRLFAVGLVFLAAWASGLSYGFGLFAIVVVTVIVPAPFLLGRLPARCRTPPRRAILWDFGRSSGTTPVAGSE